MIRKIGVLLILIVSTMVISGAWLLRHANLHNMTETALSQMLSTPVILDSVQFDFSTGNVTFSQLTVANQLNMQQTLFTIPEGSFEVALWPLLTNKLIIKNITADGIVWAHSPQPSTAATATNDHPIKNSLASLRTELPTLNFSALQQDWDISNVVKPNTLTSVIAIREGTDAALEQYTTWRRHVHQSPTQAAMQRMQQDLQQFQKQNFKHVKNLKTLASNIDQLATYYQQSLRIHNETNAFHRQVRQGLKKINLWVPELKTLQQNDFDTAKQQTHIGHIDVSDMAKVVFGELIITQLDRYIEHFHNARNYLHTQAKLQLGHSPVITVSRRHGTNIHFPSNNEPVLPSFVLKKAIFSGIFGKYHQFSGTILDWNSNPPLYIKPTSVELTLHSESGFWHITGLLSQQNHKNKEEFNIVGERVSLNQLNLQTPNNIALPDRLTSKQTNVSAKLVLHTDKLFGYLRLTTNQAVFSYSQTAPSADSAQKNPSTWTQDIRKLFTTFNQITVVANISGHFDAPKLSISSNIDERFSNHMHTLLGNKVTRIEQNIRQAIDQHVKEARKIASKKFKAQRKLIDQQLAALINNSVTLNQDIDTQQKRLKTHYRNQVEFLRTQVKQKNATTKTAATREKAELAKTTPSTLPITMSPLQNKIPTPPIQEKIAN